MPTDVTGPPRAATRSPSSMPWYRASTSQWSPSGRCTGVVAKRCASVSTSSSGPTRPVITRPLVAPRSTAAKAASCREVAGMGTLIRSGRSRAPVMRGTASGARQGGARSAQEGRRHTGVDGDVETGGVCEIPARQGEDGVGDVLREHLALEDGALGVELAQLLLLDAVGRRALGSPAGREDAGTAHHTVRVDPVDPYTVLAQLGRQEAYLMSLVGLGRRVGDVVRAREDGVLGRDVDDVAAQALCPHHPRRLSRDQERTARHDVVVKVPVPGRGLDQGLRDGDTGVVHDQVHPSERDRGGLERLCDLLLGRDVDGHRDGLVRTAELLGIRRSLASSSSQYSMRNFSDSSIGAYVDTASAPRITLIALR